MIFYPMLPSYRFCLVMLSDIHFSFLLLKVIVHLVRALDSIKVPTARAMIINMIGEHNSSGHILPKMLTTVLKYLARCFPKEALETKLQILYAAVKVVLFKSFPSFCSLLLYTQS